MPHDETSMNARQRVLPPGEARRGSRNERGKEDRLSVQAQSQQRVGRPKSPINTLKTDTLLIRLTARDRKLAEKEARLRGQTLSAFLRDAIQAAVTASSKSHRDTLSW